MLYSKLRLIYTSHFLFNSFKTKGKLLKEHNFKNVNFRKYEMWIFFTYLSEDSIKFVLQVEKY